MLLRVRLFGVVVDRSWPGKIMQSLTIAGKILRAAVFTASLILSGSALAGEHGDGFWLSSRSGSADNNFFIPSITNFSGGKGGKAVTKTEVFAGRSVLP